MWGKLGLAEIFVLKKKERKKKKERNQGDITKWVSCIKSVTLINKLTCPFVVI